MSTTCLGILKLHSATEGGRSQPTPENCLACVLKIDEHYYDARLYFVFSPNRRVSPGEVEVAEAVFLTADPLHLIQPGLELPVWEGREIGTFTASHLVTLSWPHNPSRVFILFDMEGGRPREAYSSKELAEKHRNPCDWIEELEVDAKENKSDHV